MWNINVVDMKRIVFERMLDFVALPDARYLFNLDTLAERMTVRSIDETFATVTKFFPTQGEWKLACLDCFSK